MRRMLALLALLIAPCAGAAPVGYASGFAPVLYQVDLGSAQAQQVGAIRLGGNGAAINDIEGLAFSPDGVLYGVADSIPGGALLRLDTSTGAATLVGNLGIDGQALDFGLAFTCDGRLWASSDTQMQLWEIDPATAASRLAGNLGRRISGLAARGEMLFGIGVEGDRGLYRIDPDSAAIALIGTLAATGSLPDAGLDFDAEGRLWAVLDRFPPTNTSDLAEIDPETGVQLQSRVLAGPGLDENELEALAIAPPVCVPSGNGGEPVVIPATRPGGLAILGLGALLIGLLAARWRPIRLRARTRAR